MSSVYRFSSVAFHSLCFPPSRAFFFSNYSLLLFLPFARFLLFSFSFHSALSLSLSLSLCLSLSLSPSLPYCFLSISSPFVLSSTPTFRVIMSSRFLSPTLSRFLPFSLPNFPTVSLSLFSYFSFLHILFCPRSPFSRSFSFLFIHSSPFSFGRPYVLSRTLFSSILSFSFSVFLTRSHTHAHSRPPNSHHHPLPPKLILTHTLTDSLMLTVAFAFDRTLALHRNSLYFSVPLLPLSA